MWHCSYFQYCVRMFSYQTPGCSKSGLFKAFSEYVMGRLGIIQEKDLQVLNKSFFAQWIPGDNPLQKLNRKINCNLA